MDGIGSSSAVSVRDRRLVTTERERRREFNNQLDTPAPTFGEVQRNAKRCQRECSHGYRGPDFRALLRTEWWCATMAGDTECSTGQQRPLHSPARLHQAWRLAGG